MSSSMTSHSGKCGGSFTIRTKVRVDFTVRFSVCFYAAKRGMYSYNIRLKMATIDGNKYCDACDGAIAKICNGTRDVNLWRYCMAHRDFYALNVRRKRRFEWSPKHVLFLQQRRV